MLLIFSRSLRCFLTWLLYPGSERSYVLIRYDRWWFQLLTSEFRLVIKSHFWHADKFGLTSGSDSDTRIAELRTDRSTGQLFGVVAGVFR